MPALISQLPNPSKTAYHLVAALMPRNFPDFWSHKPNLKDLPVEVCYVVRLSVAPLNFLERLASVGNRNGNIESNSRKYESIAATSVFRQHNVSAICMTEHQARSSLAG